MKRQAVRVAVVGGRPGVVLAALGLLLSSCGGDPTQSAEYRALEAELSSVEDDLAAHEADLAATSDDLSAAKADLAAAENALAAAGAERTPPPEWAGEHQVTVTLMELGDAAGMTEVAGALYPVFDTQPIGGFVSREPANGTATIEGLTNQVVSIDHSFGWLGWPRGWMPLSDEPVLVAPGDYFLVLWGDDRLHGFVPWTPADRDGADLVGCVHRLSVTTAPVTDVVFETDPFTPGTFGVCAPTPVPVEEPLQGLYGDGDINCDDLYHVAHDDDLPVGSVEFVPARDEITVVVKLAEAAPSMPYRIEIWSPEQCFQVAWWDHFTPTGEARLTTDESGRGEVEFVLGGIDPGTYRLNVDVVAADDWPEGPDPRLREIGGTGFSVVRVG